MSFTFWEDRRIERRPSWLLNFCNRSEGDYIVLKSNIFAYKIIRYLSLERIMFYKPYAKVSIPLILFPGAKADQESLIQFDESSLSFSYIQGSRNSSSTKPLRTLTSVSLVRRLNIDITFLETNLSSRFVSVTWR